MVSAQLKGRDFLRVNDWKPDELVTALDLADRLKARQKKRIQDPYLEGRMLGMIFTKPSTRTRVELRDRDRTARRHGPLPLGERPPARPRRDDQGHGVVLSRYLDAIMIRTFAQADVDELAEHADVPVINGLTDEFHPCQALADVMTIRERFGTVEGVRVAYLGDGNNVCHSLMVAVAKLGGHFVAVDADRLRAEP